MKKKFIILFMGMTLLLSGCQNQVAENVKEEIKEESVMEENTVTQVKEEELQSFASGIKTEETEESATENNENTEAVNEIVNDGLIENKCPVSIASTKAIIYGTAKHETYYSETCGMERGYNILLPSGYDEAKQYPVLYMLHGIFGDEYSFVNDSSNKIKEIVGNMAAEGYIEETIVVYPNIYAKTDENQKPGFDAASILPYDNFAKDLVNDLMPHIEENYSVLTGRENTYLAGFSMGGRETLYTSLLYPEKFGYVCSISPAPGLTPGKDWAMEHVGSITEDELHYAEDAVLPEVLLLCCGTKDSVVGTFPKSYHEIMDRNSVEHTWWEIEGADHDNNAIKSGIYNLFKQIGYNKQK